MKKPICSIIIPTFNSEATVSRALGSILCQTYHDYEIVIIDGLSTDKTHAIVKTYQDNHSSIKWFSQADNGIFDAMNKGIDHAKGCWLYFMGSDDFLFNKEVLYNIFSKVKSTSHDVIYGNVYYASLNKIYDGEFTNLKLYKKNICHQAIFLKRTVFDKIGNFDLSYKSVADWHHNIKWFYNKSIRHQFIEVTIAEYSDGGFSSQHRDEKFLEMKNELFLKYGCYQLPLKKRIEITTKIVKKYRNNHNWIYFFSSGLLLFCMKLKKMVAGA